MSAELRPKLTISVERTARLPVVTLLTGETLEMVNVIPGAHHHLEGRDQFAAGGAVACGAEQPEEGGTGSQRRGTSYLGEGSRHGEGYEGSSAAKARS